jgi:hypothetical protein
MQTSVSGVFRVGAGLMLLATAGFGAQTYYAGTLTGAQENPAVASTGIGTATATYDASAHTLNVQLSFSGLTGNTTAAHIHCCIAPPGNVGVATQTPSFSGFPLGVTSGAYNSTFDLTLASSFSAAFVAANGGTAAGAEAALAAGLANGQAYFNVHTSFAPGGEIRSFLAQEIRPVPALSWPGIGALATLLAAAAVLLLRRR